MTHPKLTSAERKVKGLILSGHSRHAIASKLGIAKSTVYDIVANLEHYGEIRAIPGTKNPVIYEDPNISTPLPPKGEESSDSGNNGRAVQNNGPSGNWKDDLPEVNLTGIHVGKECPDGYVIAHMSGGIRFEQVRKIGNFDPIKDVHDQTCGFWEPEKPTNMKGNRVRSAKIHVFGADMKLQFRMGSKGGLVFTVNPGRIHLDPKRFDSMEDAKAVFIDRALYIACLLRRNGWQLTGPQIKGLFDYALEKSPVVAHLPKGMDAPGDIFVDTSPGEPEAEMSEAHGLTDWEKVQIFASIPTEIQSAKARLANAENRADETDGRIDTVSRAVVVHQERIDSLDLTMDRLLTIQEKQATALINIADQTNLIITAQNNINLAISKGQQRTLDDIFSTPDGQPIVAQSESSLPTEPRRLEGYQ